MVRDARKCALLTMRMEASAKTKPAPAGGAGDNCGSDLLQELAFSTVTARRFCDQQEMSLHTATGRSLP